MSAWVKRVNSVAGTALEEAGRGVCEVVRVRAARRSSVNLENTERCVSKQRVQINPPG